MAGRPRSAGRSGAPHIAGTAAALVPYTRIIFGNVGVLVLRLGIIATISHALDEAAAASFLYLYSTALVLALNSDFGMRSWVFIEVGRSGRLEADLARSLFAARRVFGAATFVAMIAWGLVYFGAGGLEALDFASVLLFGIFAVGTPFADPGLFILVGQGRAELVAAARTIEFLIVATLVALAMAIDLDPRLLIGCWIIAALARGVWSRHATLGQEARGGPFWSLREAVSVGRKSFSYWLLVLVNALAMRYVILLSPLALAAPEIIFVTLGLMVVQIGQVVSSSIAHRVFGQRGGASGLRPLLLVSGACMILGIAMGAGFWVLRGLAGRLLDADFAAAPVATVILAASFPLLLLNDFLRYVCVDLGAVRLFNLVVLGITAAGAALFVAMADRIGLVDALGIYAAGQAAQAAFVMLLLAQRLRVSAPLSPP